MISFIICEDEHLLAEQYKKEIDGFMLDRKIRYCCYYFSGYNDIWKKMAREDLGFKVYILDIETTEGSGLDAARMIREELNDWASMIMIVTSYEKYRYPALCKRLMLMDFINKEKEFPDNFRKCLNISMSNYDNKFNCYRFIYKNQINSIEFRHINCIEKEPDSKRCIIRTDYGNVYYVIGNLNDVIKNLDARFIKVHRSLVINTRQILSYNSSTNTVTFKDLTTTNLISREAKKEMVNYVGNIL